MLLPAPVDTTSSTCAQSLHGALLHAMLCASATHSHNLSSSVAPGSHNYGQQAKKHRVESFRLLHASVSGVADPQDASGLTFRNRAESRVATVMLLIMSSVSTRTPRKRRTPDAQLVIRSLTVMRKQFRLCCEMHSSSFQVVARATTSLASTSCLRLCIRLLSRPADA